jgi:hypothetical protein
MDGQQEDSAQSQTQPSQDHISLKVVDQVSRPFEDKV